MPDLIKNDPVIWFLAAIVTGFIAGFASYRAILAVGAHEVVKKAHICSSLTSLEGC